MSVFSKLKKWLKGTNNKKGNKVSYSTSKKGLSSSSPSKSVQAKINQQKQEQEQKKKKLQEAFKTKELEVKQNSKKQSKASESNYQKNGGADKVLKKIEQKAKVTEDKTSIKSMGSNKTTKLPEIKARDNELMKRKKEATGLSTKDVQFQQKLGLNNTIKATDVKYANETHPVGSAFASGVTNGALLGLPELMQKHAAPELKTAIEDVENNYTKGQKVANVAGEIVGTFAPYAMSMGGASKLGKAIVGDTADDAVRVISNSKWMQNLAVKSGKDATELAAKVADSLVTDLGLHLTTENLQSIIMGMNKVSDTGNSGDFLPEYIKQQAINTAFNLGLDLAPLGIQAARSAGKLAGEALGNKRGSMQFVEGLGKVNDETGNILPTLKNGKQTIDGRAENLKRLVRENADDTKADVKIELNRKGRQVIDNQPKADVKAKQADIINKSNPADETLGNHTWVKNADDIKTFDEVHATTKEDITPDFTAKMVEDAKHSGEIKVYSSKPIEDGAFVTPSRMEAQNYAGNGKIYEATVKTKDVAWIDEVEGQFAKVSDSEVPNGVKSETKEMLDEALEQNEKNVIKQEPPATAKEADEMLDNSNFKNEQPKVEEEPNSLGMGAEQTARAFGDENIKTATNAEMQVKTDTYYENYGFGALGKKDTATSHASGTITGTTTSDVERAILNDMEKSGDLDYDIVHHAEIEDVISDVAKNPRAYADRIKKIADGDAVGTSFKGFSETSLRRTHVEAIVSMRYHGQCIKEMQAAGVPIPKQMYEDFANAVIATKDIASQSGGVLEMQRYFAMCNPATRRKIAERDIERLLERSRGFRFKSEYKGKLNNGKGTYALKERKAQIQEIISQNKALQEKLAKLEGTSVKDAEDILRRVDEDIPTGEVKYLTEQEVADIYTECIDEVNKMIPMTALDYIQEWRYLAMLGNPKTHIRNRIGNFVFKGVRTTSNAVGTLFEKGIKAKYLESATKYAEEAASGKFSKGTLEFVENAYGVHKIDSIEDLARIKSLHSEKDLSNLKVGDFVASNGSYRTPEYVADKLKTYKRDLEFTRKSGFSLTARNEAHGEAKTVEGKLGKDAWEKIKDTISTDSKMGIRTNKGKQRKLSLIGKASDLNSQFLENADKAALEANFRESFYKLAKSNDLTSLKEGSKEYKELYNKIVSESKDEALEATFRDYNGAAEFLNDLTRKMYDADATLGERTIGVAVNAVVPFAKTPANILKQTVRYSPVGLAQSTRALREAAAKGDAVLLNQAVDRLASGLTGTAILALGATIGMLAPDMITTNAGDSDIAKLKKRDGTQDYSITIGNYSYTLDWLTPVSTTFFIGAEVANLINNSNDEGVNLFQSAKNVGVLATRVIEPMLETSMLSGLNDMFNGINNTGYGTDKVNPGMKMLGSVAESYVSSLIPTLVGQISRSAYSSDKQLTGETDLEYFVNSLKNKAGLANTNLITEAQGAKTDSWGNVVGEKKTAGDYVKATAINLLSPANVKKLTAKETDKKIIAEYNKLVDEGIDADTAASILPKPNYDKEFDVGRSKDTKQAVEMTSKQLATYNKARATGGADAIESALENIMFNRPTTDADGNKVLANDAYEKEEKAEIIKQFEGKSTEDAVNWLMKQPQFKKASVYEQKLVLSTIFDNAGDRAKGNRRTSERAVWKAQGKDVNEYDFKNEISAKKQSNLQSAVDSGLVSYEEAVDFARNAGKTYYYEDEDGGGSSQTYYNKKQMMEYLIAKGYSYEKAEALYNAFKNSNAKAYDGSTSSGSGGWGGYHRSGGSSGSSIKNAKASAYNVNTFTPKAKSSSSKSSKNSDALDKALADMNANAKKITPPKNK